MRKNKIKLRVQPIYSIIIYFVLGLIFVFFMFIPTLLTWEKSNWIIDILFYLIMSLFLVYSLLMGILHIQFAIIDKEKVVIRNLFQVISEVKWSEVSSVKKEKKLTYNSRGYIYLDWIVIRTDESQDLYRAKYNKKNKFPILIIANKRNLYQLSKYVKIGKRIGII